MRHVLILTLLAGVAAAQGTLEDYKRGQGLQAKAQGLVVNVPGAPNWIGESNHFWYSRSVKGGTEFLLVDAAAGHEEAGLRSRPARRRHQLRPPAASTPASRCPSRPRPVDGVAALDAARLTRPARSPS